MELLNISEILIEMTLAPEMGLCNELLLLLLFCATQKIPTKTLEFLKQETGSRLAK